MVTYTVCSLDVLGNADDGYDVNDVRSCGSLAVPEDATDDAILDALLAEGYLSPLGRKAAVFDGQGDDTLLSVDDSRDGRPLLQLRIVD